MPALINLIRALVAFLFPARGNRSTFVSTKDNTHTNNNKP